MVKHYNVDISKDAQRIFNFKGADTIPPDIGNIFVPVIPVTRVCNIIRTTTATNATTGTIYTTPTDKDFYLVGLVISLIKDVTSTATNIQIRVTIDGVVQTIMNISTLTLTVDTRQSTLGLPFPIKVDRNTNITINTNSATANITASGGIVGYTVEAGSQ
jgi:hypothetical protein